MAGYNLTRTVEETLEHLDKDEKNQPSFTVHLHLEYWTLNHGSKFLYNNPVASLLDDIRAHRIPVDFLELFDSAKVPFYDGCMIVELLDYRPQKSKDPAPEKPERTRVVLHPNSETLWADICLLNHKTGNQWTDQEALEIEARLLMATAPPLCLDPDPHLTRIANSVLRVSTPTVPVSLKRKASSALDPVEDETDKAKRAKWMQFMNPRQHRSHAPNYRILDTIERRKSTGVGPPPSVGPQIPLQTASTVHPSLLQNTAPQSATIAQSSATDALKKGLKKKKTDPPQQPYTNDNKANATPTPVSGGLPINQYMPHLLPNAHHPTSPATQPNAPAQGQQQYPQAPQAPPQPGQPPRPAQNPQGASPLPPNFQGSVPPTHFFNQIPPQRNVQPKPGTPATQGTPQQANAQPTAQIAQIQMYNHLQLQAQRAVAGQNQNGRSTPGQPSRSPMNTNAIAAQRGSPHTANQQLKSHSPMPGAQPLPHPNQHVNFAAMAGQYNLAQMRTLPNGQHPQAHMVAAGTQAAGASQGQPQDQQGHAAPMMPQYPMYNYTQVGYRLQPGQIPPQYAWPMGVGRGMPMSAQQMPNMQQNGTHPQQMMNVQKAVPGGMQGR